MPENASDPKTTAIITAFGIAILVLAAINRFFLSNILISAIVVTLSIIFFGTLVWFYVNKRKAALKVQPKQTKQKPKK
jgi:uncharacterized protein (DUF58 family)